MLRGASAAYALIYAAMVLLLISMFLGSLRTSAGTSIDRVVNSHIAFQSALYLNSLEEIANIYVKKGLKNSADFRLDSAYFGGFEIVGEEAFLYIEALNRRTGQTMRSTRKIKLKRQENLSKAESKH